MTGPTTDRACGVYFSALRARRGLPHLIKAGRIKKLELRRAKYERDLAPLMTRQEVSYEAMEEARARRIEAQEAENLAYAQWHDTHLRVGKLERAIKEPNTEIARLKEDGSG